MKTRWTLVAACAAALHPVGARDACAQSHAFGRPGSGPETASLSIGLGVGYGPEYEGAKRLRAGLVPDLNASFTTEDFGSFAAGSQFGGLAWIPVQNALYSAGLVLSYDEGRKDDANGAGLTRGSTRLRGLGSIGGTVLYGGFGSVTIDGLALSAFAVTAPRHKGFGGSFGTVSLDIALRLAGVDVSLSPSLNWADGRFMQAYFGVTPEQSQRSGLRAYSAGGGIKSYGLTVSTQLALERHWSLTASVGAERLVGDAATSPIVERKLQPTAHAGLSRSF